MDTIEGMRGLAQDIAAGFEALEQQLNQQRKIETELRQQLAKYTAQHNPNSKSSVSDGASSEWQDVKQTGPHVENGGDHMPVLKSAKCAIARLKVGAPTETSRKCPVSHIQVEPPEPEIAKCPVQHRLVEPNFNDMEHDFTTQGKPSSLECPFAMNSQLEGIADPIAAEFHADSLSTQDAARACGRCPIRFLDKHSPEEVAQYFENHKHELPRSHEICVKRYQQNEHSIRQLDAKYGNIVSMIQGLGNKHKAYLPEDEKNVESDQLSTAAVENWAKKIEIVDDNVEHEQEPRVSRFQKPLRDIRVGESPTRPWGISVPLNQPIVGEEQPDRPHLQNTTDGGERAAHTPDVPILEDVRSTPQFLSADQKFPGQIIVNGPVFIGYTAEEASKLMADWMRSGPKD